MQCGVLTNRYISLLRLLRLGRAYRLWNWVLYLTYNQTLSLLAVTLVRNFAVSPHIGSPIWAAIADVTHS